MSTDHTHESDPQSSSDAPPRYRRRWGLALSLGLMCGIAAAAAAYLRLPPNYVAESTIYIQSTPPKLLDTVQSGYQDFETFKKTQMYKAISRLVLDTALNEPVKNEHLKRQGYKTIDDLPLLRSQLDMTKIDWLLTKLSVDGLQEEFFQIRMEHSGDPAQLAEIVNAITQVYIRDIADEDKAALRGRIATLDSLVIDKESDIKELRTQVKRLAERLGADDVENLSRKERTEIEIIEQLRKEYIQRRFELENLKIEHQVAVDSPLETDEQTAELIDNLLKPLLEITKVELQAERLRKDIEALNTDDDNSDAPQLAKSEQDLASLEEKLKVMKQDVQPLLKESLKQFQSRQQANGNLTTAERIKNLELVVAEYQKRLEKAGAIRKMERIDSFELDSLVREKDRLIAEVDQVKDRVQKLKVELDAPDRIKLQAEAELPQLKDLGQLYPRCGLFGGVTFLLVFVVTVLCAPKKRL